MPRAPAPQLVLAFVSRRRTRGGLDVDQYADLVDRLRADAARVADAFCLPPFHLDADRPTSTTRYGVCSVDGTILVRLVHARTGRPLKYSALVDTVVHELAHLRHFDHGPQWEQLYQRMLAWCRAQGIYAPRDVAAPGAQVPGAPAQLGLFGR